MRTRYVLLGLILYFLLPAMSVQAQAIAEFEWGCDASQQSSWLVPSDSVLSTTLRQRCTVFGTSDQYTSANGCRIPGRTGAVIEDYNFANWGDPLPKGELFSYDGIVIKNSSTVTPTFICHNCGVYGSITAQGIDRATIQWDSNDPSVVRRDGFVSKELHISANVVLNYSLLGAPMIETKTIYGVICVNMFFPSDTDGGVPTSAADTTTTATTATSVPKIDFSKLNKLGTITKPQQLIGKIISGLMGILGTTALVMMIYGGVMWMTAGGNSARQEKALQTILWAGLGIMMIFASYALVNFVFEIFR